jgi:hypothetical protein
MSYFAHAHFCVGQIHNNENYNLSYSSFNLRVFKLRHTENSNFGMPLSGKYLKRVLLFITTEIRKYVGLMINDQKSIQKSSV